ncbi:MAG TPA: phospholipase A2 [Polyangiaceae bacterium]|nr:phospholipase A2 [Polyangiaceae bacterium]
MPDPVSRAAPSYSGYEDLCCREEPAPTAELSTPPTARAAEEPGTDAASPAADGGAGGAVNAGSEVDGGRGAGSADPSAPPAPSADGPWRPRVNGCTVVPDRGAAFDFYAACKRHDLDYQTCGLPRWEADERLHDAMLASCGDSPAPEACRARADVYYLGVRVGGALPYAAGQEAACREAPLASWPADERYPGEPAP